ncbi:MAG: aromatic ring-hydroxylating dioxygenase subunit alpha [Burkholderiaceae bacterium]
MSGGGHERLEPPAQVHRVRGHLDLQFVEGVLDRIVRSNVYETDMQDQEIPGLIVDDADRAIFRVDRRSFTDPDVLRWERERIFDKCWLFAGHESEVRKPGDFITRKVAGRSILITRGQDKVVRAFLNSCTHRGNPVALEPCGNARAFTCFYHAWTFDTKGSLIGVPGEDSYGCGFDKKEMGLKPVPRFDSYRGMMFVCYDPNAVALVDFLGPEACRRLDYFLDFGGEGGVEIAPGTHSYSMKANWKLLVENSIDGYHAMSTHQRYFRKYLPDIGMDPSKWLAQREPGDSRGRSLGNGHTVIESLDRGTPLTISAKEELAQIRASMVERFGEAYTRQAADHTRNILIFPNLALISMFKTVRTFYPVAENYLEVDAWGLFPEADSPELRRKRLDNFLSFQGPGGFATPDDVSGLEGCQRGFASQKEVRFSDISRGMNTTEPTSTDELQMRSFWRKWHRMLQGDTSFADCDDHPAEAALRAKEAAEAAAERSV